VWLISTFHTTEKITVNAQEKKGPLSTQLPISASVVGRYHIVVGVDAGIDRLMSDLEDAPMPPPIGTVRRLSSSASQFAVMRGAVKYHPWGG
jgi:hypothetical protein